MSNPHPCPECERLREDRNEWRRMYIDLLRLVHTLRDLIVR